VRPVENIPRPEGPYYRPQEVAEMLGIDTDSVYNLIRTGKMRALKIWFRRRAFYWIHETEIKRFTKEEIPRDKLLSTKEVAAILDVNPERVIVLIRKGKLKAIKVGLRYKIPQSEVLRLRRESENNVPAPRN